MYFIVGNTLVNKRFYALPIKMLQVVNKCCRSSPQFYKLSINVVGHLHLVLATGLEFLLLPPSQLEGRFSGLNCCHHCHYWNLCCHLVFMDILAVPFQVSFGRENLVTIITFHIGMCCLMLFQPLEIWIRNWLFRAFSNYAHEHSVTVLLVHHSFVIYQISFHNCSVRTFFTVELSFTCLVLLMQIFMLDQPSLSLHDFATFSALPPFSYLLIMNSFHVSDDRSKSKLLMANRTIHLEWGGHVASMTQILLIK